MGRADDRLRMRVRGRYGLHFKEAWSEEGWRKGREEEVEEGERRKRKGDIGRK